MGLTFSACSSCFHLGNKEQWPISKALKHILGSLGQLCLGYLLARSQCFCLNTPSSFLLFSVFLILPLSPSFSLQTPEPEQPCLWDRLNLTKLIFGRRRGTNSLPPPSSSPPHETLLTFRNEKLCHIGGGLGGSGALESCFNLACKIFPGDSAPTSKPGSSR